MTRQRAYTAVPADGQAFTLDDLAEFLVEAKANGIPGNAYVRTTGCLELNLTHGPRIARLTAVPEEVSTGG